MHLPTIPSGETRVGSRLNGRSAVYEPEFARRYRPRRTLLVGAQGIPVREFLQEPAGGWVKA
jgi:hypothetical protein